MTSVVSGAVAAKGVAADARAEALAQRLEQGARALGALARSLSDEEWHTRLPGDGRKVGVVVHHVASMYPLEIKLAQELAAGRAVVGVTFKDVDAINATHAQEHWMVTKATALFFCSRSSAVDLL